MIDSNTEDGLVTIIEKADMLAETILPDKKLEVYTRRTESWAEENNGRTDVMQLSIDCIIKQLDTIFEQLKAGEGGNHG